MKSKRKLLFLGGADIQVSAIKKAKEMGIYVITCDYLPENPGHKFANEYHNISTTDKKGILEIAKELRIDGILAYASDPAAPTAAFVAEKLGLPTNPYKVIEVLSRKDLFRKFLEEHGFNVPSSSSFDNYDDAVLFFQSLNKRAVIKPVDSSGSKGVFVIEIGEDFREKFLKSLTYSKVGKVIVEEFIKKKGYQIGGDGFAVNGQLVFRCFGDIHFSQTNALLPCAVSVPTLHPDYIVKKVHDEVQRLLTVVGFENGAMNFDILVDEEDKVYILEIGPRNGGNMIPELTEFCTGVDMKEYSILSSLGMDCSSLRMTYEKRFFSHYVIHSNYDGMVSSVAKSGKLVDHILYEHKNFKKGDVVERFESSSNRLGIMLLKYNNEEEMLELINNMDKNYIINVI
ncbi:MAG: ATP-grasp domain-containing protein [Chitinophagaceae bacterium]|nr:ATP-grasp domain-containing protein [Chitinophagaceae bacterium]